MADPPPGSQYLNDNAVEDTTRLLRRIPPGKAAKGTDPLRPESGCFSDSPDGSGTSLSEWTDEHGPDQMLDGFADYGLVWITAKQVRDCGLGVIRWKLPDDDGHCHVQGKKTSKAKKGLAKACANQWYKLPSPLHESD